MRRFSALLTTSLFLLISLAGCKDKVDCDKMRARLSTCMQENYKALNKKGRDLKNPRFTKDANKLLADYEGLIDKHYTKQCEAIGGKEKRAKKINKCLAQKSCPDVHACLKHVLK